MKVALYKMQCITNTHVGNGDNGYSVIGNEVEKDPILGTPVIHGSSIKGALREYCALKKKAEIQNWFGSEINETKEDQGVSKPGKLRFLSAHLLVRPVRVSSGAASYALATTVAMLKAYRQLCEKFGVPSLLTLEELNQLDDNENFRANTDEKRVGAVEGCEIKGKVGSEINEFFQSWLPGEDVVILSEKLMREIELPIIARNKLENGISTNLWYEEVVPHESVFYTIVFSDEIEMDDFDKIIDKKVVQIGGNASIGCGYIEMKRMNLLEKEIRK